VLGADARRRALGETKQPQPGNSPSKAGNVPRYGGYSHHNPARSVLTHPLCRVMGVRSAYPAPPQGPRSGYPLFLDAGFSRRRARRDTCWARSVRPRPRCRRRNLAGHSERTRSRQRSGSPGASRTGAEPGQAGRRRPAARGRVEPGRPAHPAARVRRSRPGALRTGARRGRRGQSRHQAAGGQSADP